VLSLTDEAVAQIQTLLTGPDHPDTSGLRIFDEDGRFVISLADGPADQDQIVEGGAARVFLDHAAADALDDKTLDATTDGQGDVRFSVFEPGPSGD
jgi:iron-sulfur cluster assembly protein